MALEAGVSYGSFGLPPLSDASFTSTPDRASSRRSSRRATSPPNSSSPAPRSHSNELEDGEEEEPISVLDPRRFTPTLHANLVSEILNLRREVESKNKIVLNLEESLSSVKDDNTQLNETIASSAKENRKMKRHMQMLEGGTMSALEEIAQERDKSNEALAEVKARLEASQKKIKKQEEDNDRTNALWAKDQDKWETEKRQLDQKVHIVEGRLKTVLSEIEAAQANGIPKSSLESHERPFSRTSERPLSRTSGARSSLSHRRSSSVSTDGGARKFRLSHISEVVNTDNGATLADELQFDDDFDEDELDHYEPNSPEALPEESVNRMRPFSAQSHRQSVKARKLLGLAVGEEEEDENVRDAIYDAADLHCEPDHEDVRVTEHVEHKQYTDTATQFSPPSSPTTALHPQYTLDTIAEVDDDRSFRDSKVESNKGDASDNEDVEKLASKAPEPVPMVSSACQTIEQPPSPPHTPIEGKETEFTSSSLPKPIEMCTSSTQTSAENLPSLFDIAAALRGDQNESTVPTIAIHPPSSSHGHRQSVVLPPRTKNIACQANISGAVTSIAVQTEEIRIDQRPVKLPAHLLPSAITSRPLSPAPEAPQLRIAKSHAAKLEDTTESQPKLKVPGLPNRSAKRVSAKPKETSDQASIHNVDNNANLLDVNDGNISDDSFITKEPIKKTLSKVQNSWKLVAQPEDMDDSEVKSQAADGGSATILGNGAKFGTKTQQGGKGLRENKNGKVIELINTAARPIDVRRSAMISNGAAAHVQRGRSPSAPPAPGSISPSTGPPIPVPTRSSSRKIPWGSSDGTASPTPQTVSFFAMDQQAKQKRPPVKKPVLRKIRSATNELYMQQPMGQEVSSPPPTSLSSFPDSPQLPAHPPLPTDDVKSPYRISSKTGQHGYKPSVTSAAGSAASEQTSVVDSIAQTMIGEWMWKYVRRRTTFGLPDTEYERGETSNGVRHQRWVWLAPYERAVMWSSKQPTSGPALMGKSGRKLTIQSVLDVRDDGPLPKGANTTCFGRSILILTPQRALKFTASSRDRHYIWLTALSFLSHSSVVPAELGAPAPPLPSAVPRQPQPPPSSGVRSRYSNSNLRSQNESNVAVNGAGFQQPPPPPPASGSLRRHPIRDSIRVAKSKPRPPIGGRRSYTDPKTATLRASQTGLDQQQSAHYTQPQYFDPAQEDDEDDAAEAPHVPRHTRRRSNTGPKAPSASFRSFSSSTRPSLHSLHSARGNANGQNHTRSLQSRAESDASHGWQTDGGAAGSTYGSVGKRSVAGDWPPNSAPPEAVQGNFFDAMGMIRMEAFVKDSTTMNGGPRSKPMNGLAMNGLSMNGFTKPPTINGADDGPLSAPIIRGNDKGSGTDGPERKSYRTRQGRKKDMNKYWGAPMPGEKGSKEADPFEGF